MAEYAFIGRSNVGKSSLINDLVNQKTYGENISKTRKNSAYKSF